MPTAIIGFTKILKDETNIMRVSVLLNDTGTAPMYV